MPEIELRTTAREFEPLRAEPNGFLVHHLNHSVTLSRRACSPANVIWQPDGASWLEARGTITAAAGRRIGPFGPARAPPPAVLRVLWPAGHVGVCGMSWAIWLSRRWRFSAWGRRSGQVSCSPNGLGRFWAISVERRRRLGASRGGIGSDRFVDAQ